MPSDEPPRSAPKRILIVEDNELNMKLLNDVLEAYGYDIVKTASGAAVLELARQHRPDLVLMDIQLPDVSGLDAVRQLKAGLRNDCGPPPSVSSPAKRKNAALTAPAATAAPGEKMVSAAFFAHSILATGADADDMPLRWASISWTTPEPTPRATTFRTCRQEKIARVNQQRLKRNGKTTTVTKAKATTG